MSKIHDISLLNLNDEIGTENKLRWHLENSFREVSLAENVQYDTELFSKYIDKFFEKINTLVKDENQVYKFSENIIYDFSSKNILNEDKIVKLNNQEVTLLEYLIKNRGNTVPHETLMYIISKNSCSSMETLRTVIKRLRSKIDKSIIETISKVGYRLDLNPKR